MENNKEKKIAYGKYIPDNLAIYSKKIIIDSSEILEQFSESANFKPIDEQSIRNIENYLDQLSVMANASRIRSERDVLANALETWRYFLAGRGISIRNHLIKARKDIIDTRVSPESVSGFIKSNLHSSGRNINIIHGKASRDSIDKTVRIVCEKIITHKVTKKRITRTKSYLVHDEFNKVSSGDLVIAKETRPLSKRKRFEVIAVLRQ